MANVVQRIARNTLFMILARIISKIVTFVFIIFAARYLGRAGLGKYSFVFAFMVYFALLANFGFDDVTIREVARSKEEANKYLSNAVILKIGFALAATLMMIGIIYLMHYPPNTTRAVIIVAASLIFFALAYSLQDIFTAFEKLQYTAFMQIFPTLLSSGLSIYALVAGYGLIGVVIAWTFSSLISLLVNYILVATKLFVPKLTFDARFRRRLLSESWPFFFSAFVFAIYFKIDIIMLSIMKSDQAVGSYSAAYHLLEALIFIPECYFIAAFPVMSRYFKTSRDALALLYRKSFFYLFILSLPIAAGTTLLASRIIVIFGASFLPAAVALQVLIWTIVFLFSRLTFINVLNSINQQRITFYVYFLGMIFNILANLVLIPRYSYVGSSWATVFSEVLTAALLFYAISKFLPRLSVGVVAKPILATLAMSLFVFVFRESSLLWLVPAAVLVYLGVLFLLRTFSAEDVDIWRRLRASQASEGG